MRIRTLSVAVSLILVGASAAGCSSASGTTGAVDSAGKTPAAAASAGTGAGTSATTGAAVSKDFDTCVAFPAAAASQITGVTFTTTKASNTAHVIFDCDYQGTGAALLQISVTTQGGKVGYDSAVSALTAIGHAPTSVSGVGDEAFSEPDPKGNAGSVGASSFGSYGALFGDTYVQIGGLTYVTADQGKQIAEQLHSKL